MGYHYPHRRLKRMKERRLGFWGAIETVYYELKPILFLYISVYALRSMTAATNMFVKYTAIGVAAFCLYVIYSRLHSRGYI